MPRTHSPAITRQVIAVLEREFIHIDWTGTHGSRHWARVRLHGLAIAGRSRASARVVELFAFLHDARRQDEWVDPGHGERSARLVTELGARLWASRGTRSSCSPTPAFATATAWSMPTSPCRPVGTPTAWTWAASGSFRIRTGCARPPRAICCTRIRSGSGATTGARAGRTVASRLEAGPSRAYNMYVRRFNSLLADARKGQLKGKCNPLWPSRAGFAFVGQFMSPIYRPLAGDSQVQLKRQIPRVARPGGGAFAGLPI